MTRLLGHADDRPVTTIALASASLYLVLTWVTTKVNEPILLERAAGKDRVMLYGQFASSSVALLAVALTVLAILTALPDRPAVAQLREGPTWPRLQGTLLATAGLCITVMVAAHLGAAIDNADVGRAWLELIVLVGAFMAVASLVLAGVVFGLFLRAAEDGTPHPGEGRGLGAAGAVEEDDESEPH